MKKLPLLFGLAVFLTACGETPFEPLPVEQSPPQASSLTDGLPPDGCERLNDPVADGAYAFANLIEGGEGVYFYGGEVLAFSADLPSSNPPYAIELFVWNPAGEQLAHPTTLFPGTLTYTVPAAGEYLLWWGTSNVWNATWDISCLSFVPVTIDIKPGSDPNSINLGAEKEIVSVAILTTDDFDATGVDHTTVVFEGASETHIDKKTGEARRHEEDVDDDGDIDLVLHFRLGDTSLDASSTEATLTGATYDGRSIEGTDAVMMIARAAAVQIDGVLSPGEWNDAVSILVRDTGPYAGTTVYAMTDETNVYFALRAPLAAPTAYGDRLMVRFDNANDGILNLNEDQICTPVPPRTSFDCHTYLSVEGIGWSGLDAQQDGSFAETYDGAWKIIEVRKPLSSGDPYDFSLALGDVVGFCAAFRTGTTYVDYPARCIYSGTDQSGYAKLEITRR